MHFMETTKKLILGIAGLLIAGSLLAQKSKWGDTPKDSAECVKHYSLFSTFYEQKNYDDAITPWRHVYNNCPAASKNIYIAGIKMYRHKMSSVKNNDIYRQYIDSLFLVLNQRAEYFPKDKGKVEGYIGVYHYGFYKRDTAEIQVAYNHLKNSIDIMKKSASYAVLSHFVKASIDLYMAGEKDTMETFKDYLRTEEILQYQIEKTKSDSKRERLNKVKETNDLLIVNFGPMICSVLIPHFESTYSEDTKIAELKKIVAFLSTAECTDDPLYSKALDNLIAKDPSVTAYMAGFSFYKSKNDFSKAEKYLKKAINLEEIDTLKAKYYYKLSKLYYEDMHNYQGTRTAALQALKYKSNWGYPYLIIGKAYASSASSCGSEKKPQKWGAYWAAVDKFVKAKAVDSDEDLVKEANKLIGAYRGNFPLTEDAFMYTLTSGQAFTVACWINENTTVRFKD